jgi:hypothetical protein
VKRPSLTLTVAALLASACAGDGARHVETVPATTSEAEQAAMRDAAKEAARQGVIGDLYGEWGRAAVEAEGRYRAARDAAVARAAPTSTDPVRTLDELLEARDPTQGDAGVRAVVDAWAATCADFDRRLRELGNDPSTDARRPVPSWQGAAGEE